MSKVWEQLDSKKR